MEDFTFFFFAHNEIPEEASIYYIDAYVKSINSRWETLMADWDSGYLVLMTLASNLVDRH